MATGTQAGLELGAGKDAYLADFERFEKQAVAHGCATVNRLRKAALARFAELGFPGPRDEDWRFTSVASLTRTAFRRAQDAEALAVAAGDLRQVLFEAPGLRRLVFVNGQYAKALSSPGDDKQGVIVADLASVLTQRPGRVEPHLGRYVSSRDRPFVALNTAFLWDGAYVEVPEGVDAGGPVHLVFVSTTAAGPIVSHPRNLIVVAADARLTVMESYWGLGDGVCFTNGVTELAAGKSAAIDHYKIQEEGPRSFHVAALQIQQDQGSKVSSHYIGLGGALVRNEVRAVLAAEHCECTLNGLYLASGQQHMDNHTVIDHAKANCASHELYKGILDGRARGVFNGKIFVRQDAQKTDAKQTNQTLLLSDYATINTKPQLEIYADDVKCTHGATVGQLDDESIFYLRSRGIGREEARSLLTFAFANDVVGRIRVDAVRARLQDSLLRARYLDSPKDGEA